MHSNVAAKVLTVLLALCAAQVITGCSSALIPATAPTISPQTGGYLPPLLATIAPTANGTLLCYSLSGAPDIVQGKCATGSTLYTGPIPITISGETLSAVAGGPGFSVSPVSSATLTLLTPTVFLTAGSINFGLQPVGTPTSPQPVTLTNVGTAPLLISSVVIVGGNATFAETTTCGASLAVGAGCVLNVTFLPTAAGPVNATLQVTSNAASSPTSIALSGVGAVPQATLSNAALSFPDTETGFASSVQTVQLLNSGNAPMLLSGIALSGTGAAAFTQTNTCGASLAAGASCTFSVIFQPTSTALDSATLTITDNAPTSPQTVALSGNGVPDTPLAIWNDAYRHCQTEVVNIVVFGDSRSIVDTTIKPGVQGELADTFGQKWADRLRTTLQAACGSHGSGLVPLLPLAGLIDLNGDYYTGTGSWFGTNAIGPFQFGSVPAGMSLQTTSATSISFANAGSFDHLNVYCAAGPGLNPWTMIVDGAPVGSCGGTGNALAAVIATSTALALGEHTASIACAQAPCVAYGLESTSGTTGVSLHNLSVGACAAECFGLNPPSQLAFSDLIAGKQQLVLMELLTNESGVAYSTDSYRASLNNIINHERGLSGAPSVLMYAPLQDIISGQAPYYPVLAQTASDDATAYFDLRDTYGPAFLPQYFGPDMTHENNDGHALTYEQMISTLIP